MDAKKDVSRETWKKHKRMYFYRYILRQRIGKAKKVCYTNFIAKNEMM